jgi:hypothetical protein
MLSEEEDFEIKDDLKPIALKIAGKLYSSRMCGSVTPEKPIIGHEICERLQVSDGIKITGIQLRTIFNWLRGMHYPIATGPHGSGYFWALNHEELAHTRVSLKGRRNMIDHALIGLDTPMFKLQNRQVRIEVKSKTENDKTTDTNHEHTVVSALCTQLECIPT